MILFVSRFKLFVATILLIIITLLFLLLIDNKSIETSKIFQHESISTIQALPPLEPSKPIDINSTPINNIPYLLQFYQLQK